jgi:opacity protein-like surface antigen
VRRFHLGAFLALACAASTARGEGPPEPARRRVELMALGGYQLNSDVSARGGHLSVGDGPVYGAAVGLEVRPGTWAEVMWLYSEPTVRASGSALLDGSQPLQVATHYFQIGGTSGVQRDRVYLFGSLTAGAALFIPGTLHAADGSSTALGDTWRFAFTVGGGARIDLSPRLAIRLDLRAAAPVYFSSAGFYGVRWRRADGERRDPLPAR